MLEMNTEHVTHILFRVVQQDGALVGDGAGSFSVGQPIPGLLLQLCSKYNPRPGP